MSNIVLFIHVVLCLGLIVAILLQRSEGGALGIGGGSGSLLSGRGAANVLTRTTAILGGLFFLTSLALTLLSGSHRGATSVTDELTREQGGAARITAPVLDGGAPAPTGPAVPAPAGSTQSPTDAAGTSTASGAPAATPPETPAGAPSVPAPTRGQAQPSQPSLNTVTTPAPRPQNAPPARAQPSAASPAGTSAPGGQSGPGAPPLEEPPQR